MMRSYSLGFGLSLLLTIAAYLVAISSFFSKLGSDILIAGIAATQAWFFLSFYFGLGKEGKPHWNLTVFLFMLLVTFLLIAGSIWIMHHLNYNLMRL
ncbi:MAG TPA: cytochrome C oxidase subunit IV family protein [Chlamydiales bacterium]|nr:cytochrome C oxidase subunit IV family protein [Chlamydiales bacterium]